MSASHLERAVLAGRKNAVSTRGDRRGQMAGAPDQAPLDTAAIRRALGQPLPRKEPAPPAEPEEVPLPAQEEHDPPVLRPARRTRAVAVAIAIVLVSGVVTGIVTGPAGLIGLRPAAPPPDVPYQSVALDMAAVHSSEPPRVPAPARIAARDSVDVALARLAADFAPQVTRLGRPSHPPGLEVASLLTPAMAGSQRPRLAPVAETGSSVRPRGLAGIAAPDAAPRMPLAAPRSPRASLAAPPDPGSVAREIAVTLPTRSLAGSDRPVPSGRPPMPAAEPDPAGFAAIRAITLPPPLAAAAPRPRPASLSPEETPSGIASSAPPAASGTPRIVIHHPAGTGGSAARDTAGFLRAAGFERVEVRSVGFGISETNIRYFFDDDRVPARRLADAMNRNRIATRIRDFTFYAPLPSRGTIELWLSD